MHNPYEAKLAVLAASFMAISSLSACTTVSEPETKAPLAKKPQVEAPQVLGQPDPRIAVNPAPPNLVPTPLPYPKPSN